MYKRIYVPIDDSETSNQALREACRLAQELDAQLRLVHVVDLAQFGWGGTEFLDAAELQDSIKKAGEKVLSDGRSIAAEFGRTPEVQILESWGDKIPTVLAEDEKKWQADLVVMGTHGWTGVMHLLMGSVAEGLLRISNAPILLVRKKEQ